MSSFSENPRDVGPKHLRELLDKANGVVPAHLAPETPIFVLATAGMRLLAPQQRQDLLHEVCTFTRSQTAFLLPDCAAHIRVIKGDVEGLYGWMAANYLMGSFESPLQAQPGKSPHTFGFLDMGGASAQIAFAPNATEAEKHANDLKLVRLRTVGGENVEYRLFSTTWLRFGVKEARARYIEALESSEKSSKTLEFLDPCMPAGLLITSTGDFHIPDEKIIDGKIPVFKGTGEFSECLKRTQPLLEKDHICEEDPCLVAGVHVPAIDFDVNHFIGVSEYWHTTHEIFQMGEKDKAYDFNTYQKRVSRFCNQDWTQIQEGLKAMKWGDKVNEERAAEVCFKASWLINVLHEGIGIPRVGLEKTPSSLENGTSKLLDNAKNKGFIPAFQPINKIDNTEVSWTLGKVILYVCSLVEPRQAGALPVGFGSNEVGIPPDFQYPSVQADGPLSVESIPTGSSQSKLGANASNPVSDLSSGTSRRIPGFVLFLFILGFAGYVVIYRRWQNRRGHSYRHQRVGRVKRKGPWIGLIPTALQFSFGPKYEDVDLESRSTLSAPDHFELTGYLDEISSDSSNTSHDAGRSSGLAGNTKTRGSKGPSDGSLPGLHNLGYGQGLGIGLPESASETASSRNDIENIERVPAAFDVERKSRSSSPAKRTTSRIGKVMED